jgi:8-oxo-dGTP diphosphatase
MRLALESIWGAAHMRKLFGPLIFPSTMCESMRTIALNSLFETPALIHVAVAVIKNPRQEVLVALRRPDSHQGGLWEFPGGKVEEGESVFTALQREIQEELDLSISAAFPFIKISHDYGDKRVLLDVWQVTEFGGTAIGREGQQIQWLPPVDMQEQDFPAANRRIIDLLKLPLEMAITPALQELTALADYLEKVAAADVKLVSCGKSSCPQMLC